MPTEILAANLRVTYRKVGFSATTYMQKKPLARAIQQLERRISRDKDWVAEQSEFELPVPILEQPDDSWLFGSANEPLLLGLRKGLSSPRHCG